MNLKRSSIFCVTLLTAIIFFSGCKKDSVTGLAPINPENDKVTGASAKDLLTSEKFTSAAIEIEFMEGFAPDENAVNDMGAFLSSLINKPVSIIILPNQIPADGKVSYSLNDIAIIEQKSRNTFNSDTRLSVCILIVDGKFTDPNVLGVSYRNTSVCLFGKTIFDNSGGIGQVSRTKLETTVLEHELGHLLGLVDLGTPMQTNHKDAAHGNHCNVEHCLMNYASETTDLLGFLITGDIPALDPKCLADLHANGGR